MEQGKPISLDSCDSAGAIITARHSRSRNDRIMAGQNHADEPMEVICMILSGHDSVVRPSFGPADFLAVCEQFGQ
jgi:hypothetical protein